MNDDSGKKNTIIRNSAIFIRQVNSYFFISSIKEPFNELSWSDQYPGARFTP